MSYASPRLPGLVLGCLVLVASLGAQMSGSYTIDPNGTGARNFKDFANAAYQLFVQGVSGPVILDVASGTYSKAIAIAPISGASQKNTITFKSRTKYGARIATHISIADYSPQFPVRWLVFDGFDFPIVTRTMFGIVASATSCTDLEI